jgi:hypothetical protein
LDSFVFVLAIFDLLLYDAGVLSDFMGIVDFAQIIQHHGRSAIPGIEGTLSLDSPPHLPGRDSNGGDCNDVALLMDKCSYLDRICLYTNCSSAA